MTLIQSYLDFKPLNAKELEILIGDDFSLAAYSIRESYIRNIAFPLYSKEVIKILSKFLRNKKILEVGSGFGYLARLLQNNSVNIRSIDSNTSRYYADTVLENKYSLKHIVGNAIPKVRTRYDVILMSWPDYDSDFAYKIISKMNKGQILIYQGEGYGGCTGDAKFHDKLRMQYTIPIEDILNKYHVQFNGIHDYWKVVMIR